MRPALPIRLVESGPAAGALAGSWFARRLGEDRLLCFDMGGTTAKSCLIDQRRARAHQHVRGRPHLPLQEGLGLPGVGAVGRPRRDRRRRRQPRPHRRARPAEGRTGVRRRRSRARVLRPRRPRAGGHRCRPGARPARRRLTSSAATCRSTSPPATAARRSVADVLGPTCVDETAAGIHELVNQNMAAAARMHAVEQGDDLRGVTAARVRWRRAGPRLRRGRAARVAAGRSSRSTPACSSAFGTLVSPVRIDLARSMVRSLGDRRDDERDAPARRPARGGPPRAGWRRRARRSHPLPLRRSMPATSDRATRSRSGSATASTWPVTDRAGRRPRSRATTGRIYGLTIPDVACRGGHVAAVGVSRNADTVEPRVPTSARRTAGRERPCRAVRTRRRRRSTRPVYRRSDLGVASG